MFAKTIIDSDAFLDMPLSSQALYFHLSMRADDDGFLNNARKVMRTIGANQNDYDLLIVKRFIIQFPDGICVIKHWRLHNWIRGDRKKDTIYQKQKEMLDVKKNGSYTLIEECQTVDSQVVDSSHTQVRLGKDRIGKGSIDKEKKETVFFPLDDKLNQTFLDFMDMRKSLKNGKMTERAITMMVNKINKLDNDIAIQMLENSITNNWKDIYPLKDNKTTTEDYAKKLEDWANG